MPSSTTARNVGLMPLCVLAAIGLGGTFAFTAPQSHRVASGGLSSRSIVPPSAGFRPHEISSRVNVLRRAVSEENEATGTTVVDAGNPFASFMSGLMQQLNNEPTSVVVQPPVETEEEKNRRLRLERLEEIDAGEIRRQERVAEDKLVYFFLLALQLLPLTGSIDRFTSVIYFFGVAVSTVYLGGRQEVIDEPEKVSRKSALYAPVGASFAIGILYVLLKTGIDVTTLYAVGVTAFGALSISDIGVPILRNLVPSVADAKVSIPESLAEQLDLDEPELPLDGLITLGLGILCSVAYWAPVAMEQKFLVSNVIAWSLGMVSLGAISFGSFQTGAILLAGLFCYDIFWVFGTDVMMTVATKVEAPIKFLYTAPPSEIPRSYPFSVLGLGDIVIPGLFVRFMSKVDDVLQPPKLSYFNVATACYAFGLGACFVVNTITNAGQPALLYLDPSLIGGALACAAVNDQFEEVWNFKEEEEDEEDGAEA